MAELSSECAGKEPEVITDEDLPTPASFISARSQKKVLNPVEGEEVRARFQGHHMESATGDRSCCGHASNIIMNEPPQDPPQTTPAMLGYENEEPTAPSCPILEATLVQDESEHPVTVQVIDRSSGISKGGNFPCPTRNWYWKYIISGSVLLLFAVMAAVIGILVTEEPDPPYPPTPTIIYYYSDRENKRCITAEDAKTNLRPRSFETIEECCRQEFWHLPLKECLANSLLSNDTTSTTPTATVMSTSTPSNTPSTTTSTTTPHITTFTTWKQLGQTIVGEKAGDYAGFAVALSADGRTLAVGAPGKTKELGDEPGYVKVFRWDGSGGLDWKQLGTTIKGERNGDVFGHSLALSSDGKILAIGAPSPYNNKDRPGYASVYEFVEVEVADGYHTGHWKKIGQTIIGEANGDNSGYSVALSSDGRTLAVGAMLNSGSAFLSGHVRVHHLKDESSWEQIGQDIDGESTAEVSGMSVSLSSNGRILAIGAPGLDIPGYVRIYSVSDGADTDSSWYQFGYTFEGEASGDWAGVSTSLSADGNTLAIGACYNGGNGDDSGHVRVMAYDGSSWEQLGLDIDGEAAGDESGRDVDLSADGMTLAIGASRNHGHGLSRGHVRVFHRELSNWKQLGEDIDGEATWDYSGNAVSLSADGRIVAIGAHSNDDNGVSSGHVRVFQIE